MFPLFQRTSLKKEKGGKKRSTRDHKPSLDLSGFYCAIDHCSPEFLRNKLQVPYIWYAHPPTTTLHHLLLGICCVEDGCQESFLRHLHGKEERPIPSSRQKRDKERGYKTNSYFTITFFFNSTRNIKNKIISNHFLEPSS
jgi:hypothetical protein